MGLLMTCSNCSIPASFEYRITQDKSIFYCAKHLPSFLEPRKKAGLLIITESNKASKDEALSALKIEPVEEELVPEEPKPVKKAATKKKAK